MQATSAQVVTARACRERLVRGPPVACPLQTHRQEDGLGQLLRGGAPCHGHPGGMSPPTWVLRRSAWMGTPPAERAEPPRRAVDTLLVAAMPDL